MKRIIIFALALITGCNFSSPPLGSTADCDWYGKVFTWIDVNEDGVFQQGEPPLPGVNLVVNDIRNKYGGVATGVTNSKGEAKLDVFLPGCPDVEFEIMTDVLAGYRLTTAGSQSAKDYESDRTFQFGFTYLPGVPMETPKPKVSLSCTAVLEFTGEEIYSIASNQDDLWVASSIKVTQFDFSTKTWDVVYFGEKDYSGKAKDIFVGPDGEVWLITYHKENISTTIFKLNNGRWNKFSPEELQGKYIVSIAWAPDGSVWFSTWDEGIIIWNPHTNVWVSDKSSMNVKEVLFASDGKYFRINELGGGAIAPDGKVWGVSKFETTSRYGIYYDPITQKITESAITDYPFYCDMKFDNRGGMWIATCNDGLLYIPDPIKGSQAGWYDYHHEIGLTSEEIRALVFQGNDLLLVGTLDGLARCQIETR